MKESRDYLEMSFRSIECFSNDGKLDAKELRQLLTIAERDGQIDDNEARVLRNIMSRVQPHEIDADMQVMLDVVLKKIGA
ncbi:hypothetical protein [Marinobacter zhejiangensis]|uniref:Tellurite resistance protein TerB n=1 Tax=Marinobacter zhejiangensis TaxID=488535 RepID=A0A1I4P1Q7_9GAMM|nr:hypothetical protein [Marinobacter zhejiangensis]SFM21293.1 hypothetical protein SAMN04487963_1741 [Marinobacter zhejiangensis]